MDAEMHGAASSIMKRRLTCRGNPRPGQDAPPFVNSHKFPHYLSLAFAPDGGRIATANGWSGIARLWRTGTKTDFDRDRDVDLGDFTMFAACFNGPNRPPACL